MLNWWNYRRQKLT